MYKQYLYGIITKNVEKAPAFNLLGEDGNNWPVLWCFVM